LGYAFVFSYNGSGQPVLIEGYQYDYNNPYRKITYQWDANGTVSRYEDYELNENTNQWNLLDKCTSVNGVATSERWESKIIAKTDGSGNQTMRQFYTLTAGKWYMTHYIVDYPNTFAPAVETGDNTPVGGTNKGGFDLNISIPADSVASGSFVIRLPDGFALDQSNSGLTLDFSGFELKITRQEGNVWLFEIKPKGTRSASMLAGETAGKTLAHIAYTVNPTVKRGTYDIAVQSIRFESPGGEPFVEPAITVPAVLNRWGTGNEAVDAAKITCFKGRLTVSTPAAEQITVYSLSGARIYSAWKDAGTATFDLSDLPAGVYIVTGSSGWNRKVITN
jgi:hypothetical protein